MGDWFQIVEQSRYRRSVLLAEAERNRQLAAANDAGIRAALAGLLIKTALWLAPPSPRRAAIIDEQALPHIARI